MSTKDHPDWWKNVGGSNALASVLERRSVISNNGVVPMWQAGHEEITWGKFFPRGMRGWLEQIEIYSQCPLAPGGTIVVNLSPYPESGILHTANIVVPAGGGIAWRPALFRLFWNYDSMFIWWYCVQPNVLMAYDLEEPNDAYTGDIDTTAWQPLNQRRWVRVEMTGETPGDVPVSGTLNTVPIPNLVSDMDAATVVINGPDTGDIISSPVWGAGFPVLGMGQLTCLMMTLTQTLGAVPPGSMEIHIVTDGVDRMFTVAELVAANGGVVNTVSPISMALITPATNVYQVSFTLKFPFRLSLRVYVENTAAAGNNMTADALYAYELLA